MFVSSLHSHFIYLFLVVYLCAFTFIYIVIIRHLLFVQYEDEQKNRKTMKKNWMSFNFNELKKIKIKKKYMFLYE